MSAPKCRFPNCGNSTWNPNGMCHLHINASYHSNESIDPEMREVPLFNQSQADQSEIDQLISDCENVFSDMDQVTPVELRAQAMDTLTSAVSIEVYRCLPAVDGQPPEQRDRLMHEWRNYISQSSVPKANHSIDWEEASSLADSSIDEFGRGLQESCQLASFALTKEWEMAKMIGQKVDEYQIPYEDDLDDFMERMAPIASMNVSNEYYRNLHSYAGIIQEATGHPPLTVPPPPHVIPNCRLDLASTNDIIIANNNGLLAPEEVAYMHTRIANDQAAAQNQARQERANARNQQMINVAAGLGSAALGALFTSGRSSSRSTSNEDLALIRQKRQSEKRAREEAEIHKAKLRSARIQNDKHF